MYRCHIGLVWHAVKRQNLLTVHITWPLLNSLFLRWSQGKTHTWYPFIFSNQRWPINLLIRLLTDIGSRVLQLKQRYCIELSGHVSVSRVDMPRVALAYNARRPGECIYRHLQINLVPGTTLRSTPTSLPAASKDESPWLQTQLSG